MQLAATRVALVKLFFSINNSFCDDRALLCFRTVLSEYCLNTYYLELTKSTKYTEVETR